ncbi:hypothetical protein Pint_33568 [Pistacia integerrima]|uniref:Uncharacterized protein n=1 Tax=Pistacia integerrima TaxID=434235 RepID=A0ACC0X350_9ROSI|nr:hypothetical protein Pint_33568 [Pistacia integerrima]
MGICKPNNEVPIPTQKKSYKTHEQKQEPEDNLCYGSDVERAIFPLCVKVYIGFSSWRNHKKSVRDDYEENGDCMVASFADIQREERKSAKIGKNEDRIEQEERKEKLRRQSKKHKLVHI